jgi:hypothetical protein
MVVHLPSTWDSGHQKTNNNKKKQKKNHPILCKVQYISPKSPEFDVTNYVTSNSAYFQKVGDLNIKPLEDKMQAEHMPEILATQEAEIRRKEDHCLKPAPGK